MFRGESKLGDGGSLDSSGIEVTELADENKQGLIS